MPPPAASRLRENLAQDESSDRLKAALEAGTRPDPEYIDVLVERCAIEPDFYVRDMLTWALTRQAATATVPRLLTELHRSAPQARSQALHTLSKIGDPVAWPAITTDLLRDPDERAPGRTRSPPSIYSTIRRKRLTKQFTRRGAFSR